MRNNCGCGNRNYMFPQADCSEGYPQSAEPQGCSKHFPYLRQDFTVPAVDSETTMHVTDTSKLYVGQGILVGAGFYQITDVVDSTNLKVKHNGVGAAAGLRLEAVHTLYGCYSYPIVPCGIVMLPRSPALAGIDATAQIAIASSITATAVNSMLFGYTGPTTIEFHAEVLAQIGAEPWWLGIELPVPVRTAAPRPSFSAYIKEGTGDEKVAVARLGEGDYSNFVLVGYGEGIQISTGTDRLIHVSGKCEIEI